MSASAATNAHKLPEGGEYKTFASAITEAKNVLKLGVRLEVTAMSKRTSTKKCIQFI